MALQKDGVEDAAQMGKQPNHNDNSPIVLVISVEVSASIVSLRSYSADYQTSCSDQRDQTNGSVNCHPDDVLPGKGDGRGITVALGEEIAGDKHPGAKGQ